MLKHMIPAALLMTLPAPAMAGEMCTIMPDVWLVQFEHGDPFEEGIGEDERARRMAYYEIWLEQTPERERQRWADAAETVLAETKAEQARRLARLLIPDVNQVSYPGICANYDGPTPWYDDRLFNALKHSLDNAPPEQMLPDIGDDPNVIYVTSRRQRIASPFERDYGRLVDRCNQRTIEEIALAMQERLESEAIASVLGSIFRHGYGYGYPLQTTRNVISRFARGSNFVLDMSDLRDPRFSIPYSRYPGLRERHDRIAEEQRTTMSEYFATDPDALAVIAFIEGELAARYDPAQPLGGYCPGEVAELRDVVETRLDRFGLQSGPWVAELLGG